MRTILVLLPLAVLAAPAAGQTAPPQAADKPLQLAPQLADPATVDRLANSMQVLSKALLDLKVGDVQAALEGRKPTRAERNLTVGDLASRNDPQFERHLEQRIADARPMIEQSIKAMNEALPEITADLQRAQKAIERAMANMPDPNYPKR